MISEYATTAQTGTTGVSGDESGINPFVGENGVGIISNADNLLLNPSFYSTFYWGQSATDCGCAATTVYSYEPYSKFGYRVLRMQSTSDCCAKGVYQDTIVLPKGTYTFSAYLRVLSTFTGVNNPGAYLRVTTTDGAVLAESERLRSRDSDFSRLVASFDVEDETSVQVHILMDGRGTLYADGAQLERHPYANPFNMLTNGNFEHNFTDWQDTTRAAVTTTEKFNMSRSLCIAGALESVCSPYQTVYVKRYITTRETFTLSGWAKAPSLPAAEREGCESPMFEVRAEIVYSDGTTETYSAPFAWGTDAWQFASVQFSKQAFKSVRYIKVYCDYSYNAGVAYFDNIQLLRDSIETDLEEADFVDTTEEPVEENENTATAEGEKDEIPEFTGYTHCCDNIDVLKQQHSPLGENVAVFF